MPRHIKKLLPRLTEALVDLVEGAIDVLAPRPQPDPIPVRVREPRK